MMKTIRHLNRTTRRHTLRTAVCSLIASLCLTSLPGSLKAQEALGPPPEESAFPQFGYYTVRPDLRKCISPLCGGYWIKLVNRERTPCIDGSQKPECYVATIDWSRLKLSDEDLAKFQKALLQGQGLLRGRVVPREWKHFGVLGELVAAEGFVAASRQKPEGTFAGLKSNGIVCITTPCFNIDEFILNRRERTTVSDVDLSRVNATREQIALARRAIATKGLVAVGKNRKIPDAGPAGTGVSFVASQFYLRVSPSPSIAPGK